MEIFISLLVVVVVGVPAFLIWQHVTAPPQQYESRVAITKEFDELLCDGGFTCLRKDEVVRVGSDGGALFVPCADGKHYLDGQLNDRADRYTGFLNLTADEGW